MKKRFLVLALTISMCFSAAPVSALADSPDSGDDSFAETLDAGPEVFEEEIFSPEGDDLEKAGASDTEDGAETLAPDDAAALMDEADAEDAAVGEAVAAGNDVSVLSEDAEADDTEDGGTADADDESGEYDPDEDGIALLSETADEEEPEEDLSEAASEYVFVAEYLGGAWQVGTEELLSAEDFTVSVYDADGELVDTVEAESVTSDYEVDEDGYILALVVCVYGGETVTVETKIAAIKTLAGEEAFAVYSATDDSFTFYYGEVPETGSQYNGKTVTNVFTGLEEDYDNSEETEVSPWKDVAESVKNVTFDASFSNARPVRTSYWFYGFKHCTEFNGLDYLNTSSVKSIDSMFEGCEEVTILDVDGWDVSNVTEMRGVFAYCYELADLDVSGWDVSSVTKMNNLFHDCTSLTSIGVSGWNTGNVISMSGLFQGSGITTLDITGWNTSNVSTMDKMFSGCDNLASLSISGIDTSSVTSMSKMFDECQSLEGLDLSGFNTQNVKSSSESEKESFDRFAYDCESLQWIRFDDDFDLFARSTRDMDMVSTQNWYNSSGDLVSDNYLVGFKGGGGTYYTSQNTVGESNVFAVYSETDHSLTFYKDEVNGRPTEGDTYNGKEATEVFVGFDTLRYRDEYVPWHLYREYIQSVVADESFADVEPYSTAYWFYDLEHCTSFDLEYLDTSGETEMEDMFYGCSSVTELNLSSFDTSNVTDMSNMFHGCSALTCIDFSSFDTSNVTSMLGMFYGCSSFTTVDLSCFDTSSVTTMNTMFRDCTGLTEIDVTPLKMSTVENIGQMFQGCTGLTELDLSSFETDSLTTMANVVNGCTNLETLNLRGWDTSNATGMASEFANCPNLQTIFVNEGDFDISHYRNDTNMFHLDYSILGQNGTTYDENNYQHEMANIDTADNPGYLTNYAMFAVYCADDGSLTFYADQSFPKVGEDYNGKTVTALYKGTVNTLEEDPLWEEIKEDVVTVACDESIAEAGLQPKSFYEWFSGMTNCTGVDLTWLDTTTATAYTDMMADMDSLEWIKIGEDFDLFTQSETALVSQQYWYDANGKQVSDNYMIGINTAGTYYTDPCAVSHHYGDPTFTWSGNYSSCTATFTCKYGDSEVEVNCSVTAKEISPTCTEPGEITYTAACDFEGTTYSDEVDAEGAPATGHTWVESDVWINDTHMQITFTCSACGVKKTESVATEARSSSGLSGSVFIPRTDMPLAATLEQYEDGTEIEYILGLEDINDTVTLRDARLVENLLKDEGCLDDATIYYMDIVLTMHVISGDYEAEDTIAQTAYPVTITIRIPDELLTGEEGEYHVIRVHNGKAEDLPTTNNGDGTLTFETDCFSTYAVVFVAASEPEPTPEPGPADEKVNVSGTVHWDDDNDKADSRPDSVTIHLYADGEEIEMTTATAADGWSWSFTDLPKYAEDGHEIVYTVTEDAPEGYVVRVDGYEITDTLVSELPSGTGGTGGTDGNGSNPTGTISGQTGDTNVVPILSVIIIIAAAAAVVALALQTTRRRIRR